MAEEQASQQQQVVEKPKENRPPQENRPPREGRPGGGPPRQGGGGAERREGGPRGENRGGENRGGENRGGERGRGDDRRGSGDRPRFDGPPEIDLDKLIGDSLYLDNQAHAVVSRMRDMDSGTKSQLRRFYNAVRRACRAPEGERQHEFVMLRARLAYTIARHSLRSLDMLEKLLLQVTRKNEPRGYERFRDLFEAIVAYNE
jgi:CRISPR type III-A-associated protein Csm2